MNKYLTSNGRRVISKKSIIKRRSPNCRMKLLKVKTKIVDKNKKEQSYNKDYCSFNQLQVCGT